MAIMKNIQWNITVIEKIKLAYYVISLLVLLIPVEFDDKTTIVWYFVVIWNCKISSNLLKKRIL